MHRAVGGEVGVGGPALPSLMIIIGIVEAFLHQFIEVRGDLLTVHLLANHEVHEGFGLDDHHVTAFVRSVSLVHNRAIRACLVIPHLNIRQLLIRQLFFWTPVLKAVLVSIIIMKAEQPCYIVERHIPPVAGKKTDSPCRSIIMDRPQGQRKTKT
ncbi:hypothetical protein D3C81_1275510 [compost metagenome]